ncbi:MAG: hypothetical protein QM831_14405 [Kofleriaceae bacterium]
MIATPEHLPHEIRDRARERRVRDVALVLIVLAGTRPPAIAQLCRGDERTLADARATADQQELRRTALRDAIQDLAHHCELGIATVGLAWRMQPPHDISLSEGERGERARAQAIARANEVGLEAGRGLIAIVRRLREELPDDRGEPGRHVCRHRGRQPREMAMDPLRRFLHDPGQATGEQLVEHDAE